jgi:hypothetical protein
MAVLHDIDVRAPAPQIDSILGDIHKAHRFFSNGATARNASVRAVAIQGGRIIASVRHSLPLYSIAMSCPHS